MWPCSTLPSMIHWENIAHNWPQCEACQLSVCRGNFQSPSFPGCLADLGFSNSVSFIPPRHHGWPPAARMWHQEYEQRWWALICSSDQHPQWHWVVFWGCILMSEINFTRGISTKAWIWNTPCTALLRVFLYSRSRKCRGSSIYSNLTVFGSEGNSVL